MCLKGQERTVDTASVCIVTITGAESEVLYSLFVNTYSAAAPQLSKVSHFNDM